eukprot:1146924-Pelagomonas_calceolata.AAC.2
MQLGEGEDCTIANTHFKNSNSSSREHENVNSDINAMESFPMVQVEWFALLWCNSLKKKTVQKQALILKDRKAAHWNMRMKILI